MPKAAPSPAAPLRRPALAALLVLAGGLAAVGAKRWTPALPQAARAVAGDEPQPHAPSADEVRLYWDRDGLSRRLVGGTALASGDKVLAEVTAREPVAAYWGVVGPRGEPLGDQETLLATRMEVAPGERRAFAGSLELLGASKKETLVVLLCPHETPQPTGAELLASLSSKAPGPCKRWRQRLR